jgi:type I restriction enzyme S subunit
MKRVRVGDVAEQVRGVTFAKKDSTKEKLPGHTAVLTASNITEGGLQLSPLQYVPNEMVRSTQKLKNGDILVTASSGSLDVVGRAVLVDRDLDAGFGAFCKVLRFNDQVDPRYVAHYFRTTEYRSTVSRLAAGANINNLRNEDLDGIEIPLPPLPEQRRIASILDEAQTLRRLAENRVVLLEEMVRSAFRATQASASLARVRLSDIAEVVGGSTPKSGVAELWDGDIPWITPADLSKNADLVISKTARTISDQGLRSIGNRLLPTGAVLFSSRAPIGLVGIVGVPMATNQGFKSLIPDAEIVDSTYLYWWLRANRATLERRGVGATFKELSKAVVESIELALPPIEGQREFGRLARDAEEARLRAVASLWQAQVLTESLLDRAFRGEL